LEQTQDEQEIIARVAALDIGKAELVCCVRVPDPKGGTRRVQEVKTYSTMTRSLQVMADRLLDLDVAGQRQRRQEPPGSPQDRPAGRGLVVQGRRTPDAAAQLRATTADPPPS